MSDVDETKWADKIGESAYGSILDMVAALQCDYERLEELKEERDDFEPEEVPEDFEVTELDDDDEAEERATCGTCGRSWDDAVVTGRTPAPSGRCPFEEFHATTWASENPDDAEELDDLEEAAGECKDADEARERIQEDALSVEVRSDWTNPGEKMTPGEYRILLSTGGPATQIVGDLDDHGEPHSARLEVQDWFKPWTQYFPASQEVLLTYARCFTYGE